MVHPKSDAVAAHAKEQFAKTLDRLAGYLRFPAISSDEGHAKDVRALAAKIADDLRALSLENVKLLELPEPPARPRLGKDEWGGALAVFLWVFIATFPVVIPFIFVRDVGLALRLSNAIAIVLLFITGAIYGRVAEYRPWLTGLAMVVLGCALVGMTIALGG